MSNVRARLITQLAKAGSGLVDVGRVDSTNISIQLSWLTEGRAHPSDERLEAGRIAPRRDGRGMDEMFDEDAICASSAPGVG